MLYNGLKNKSKLMCNSVTLAQLPAFLQSVDLRNFDQMQKLCKFLKQIRVNM